MADGSGAGPCQKCGSLMTSEPWESSWGSYSGEKHTCLLCGHVEWIEGTGKHGMPGTVELRGVLHEADPDLVARFEAYHQANPHVHREFCRRALAMKAAGRQRYSQWTIIQSIRWDHDLRTSGDVFKINNDFIALYARLAVAQYPDLSDFFELRSMKPNDRRRSTEERYRRRESENASDE